MPRTSRLFYKVAPAIQRFSAWGRRPRLNNMRGRGEANSLFLPGAALYITSMHSIGHAAISLHLC